MGKKTDEICDVASNKKIAEDHFILEITAPKIAKNAVPGQFVSVQVREERATDPLIRIPLGIYRIKGKKLSLLYKVVGRGTRMLSEKKKGKKVRVLGPLGNGFMTGAPGGKEKAVVVAGGHGVAPLVSLTEKLIKDGKRVVFLIGARTKKHVVCDAELRKAGARVCVSTEDGTRGKKGYVTELLKEYLKTTESKEKKAQGVTIYACGPKPMLEEVSRIAKERKMKAQVSLDAYMVCGIGACLGCAVKTTTGYKMVCKDGPVFGSEEIVWKER
ncbi:MAG: dihydroorotate dehydrogenase electron transfer subunit [Candidatus Omnitrophica bacterium]|jgi:dihydroorotate dehydrogenase electron transfer subunit|nr:dihydroorotate dehydrogenase electron transfer subunit [Candidatus Omnitrophota bacterium]